MSKSWDLDDGLKLVRAIQQECRTYGYHLTLGGGVLNTGRSDKDLDLYFLPLDNDSLAKPDPDKLVEWLKTMWGTGKPIAGSGYEETKAKPIVKYYEPLEPDGAMAKAKYYEPERPLAGIYDLDAPLAANEGFGVKFDPQLRRFNEFVVGEQFVVGAPLGVMAEPQVFKAKPSKSKYVYKLKFIRSSGDRIDVFVL